MFIAIYQFKVKPGKNADFISAWEALTQLIYEYEGSLGSRLHQQDDTVYIAYAQWPDKETWKNSGDKLPASADPIRKRMKSACEQIETLFELDTVSDLLKTGTYND